MSEASFFAENEYAPLAEVCLRLPGAASYDPHRRRSVILERQKQHYDWDAYDNRTVRTELTDFRRILVASGARVVMIDNAADCPAQHFPRDLGFVVGNTLFIGRLKSAARQGEAAGLVTLFGNRTDVHILDSGTIEGGDVMLDDGIVYVGLSEETSTSGVRSLERAMERRDLAFEVVPIAFAHEGVLHLDTVFNIVAPGVALIQRSAFAKSELRRFETRFDIISLSDLETRRVEINTLTINEKTILVRQGSARLVEELERRNLTAVQVGFSEVCKMPGSLRCCTLPLRRERIAQNSALNR